MRSPLARSRSLSRAGNDVMVGVWVFFLRGRYVDAERTSLGLQLLNVSVLHPHDDSDEVEVVQIVGTDEDIKHRQDKRDQLLASKQSYLRAIPDHEIDV